MLCFFLLEPFTQLFRRWTPTKKLIDAVLTKTRRQHSARFKKWGALFLPLFISVPLPGSGGFTGALIAYLFGVKKSAAFILISLGIAGSGVIVSLVLVSSVEAFKVLLPTLSEGA